jgi:hypothetical protein
MRKVTGHVIDPYLNEVVIVELDGDSFEDINKAIGCDIFCLGARLTTGDILYVDDMGWLDPKVTRAFMFGGEDTVLPKDAIFAGRGLILGLDKGGNAQSAKTTWHEVLDALRFPKPEWSISESMRLTARNSIQVFKMQ